MACCRATSLLKEDKLEDGESSDGEVFAFKGERSPFAFAATRVQTGPKSGPLCHCGQLAEKEDNIRSCKNGCCGLIQEGDVGARRQMPPLQEKKEAAAHQQLPKPSRPMERLDPRPGTQRALTGHESASNQCKARAAWRSEDGVGAEEAGGSVWA